MVETIVSLTIKRGRWRKRSEGWTTTYRFMNNYVIYNEIKDNNGGENNGKCSGGWTTKYYLVNNYMSYIMNNIN